MILEDIVREWPYFRFHCLIKVKQDEAFNSLRSRIDPKSMLLQFDFLENAEITEQDEVQTAHWWHLQVTLFTAVAWVAGEKNCFAIISDYSDHDKNATVTFLLIILRKLLDKYPDVNHLDLFSDGASQHFKQCYTLNAVTMLTSLLGMQRNKLSINYGFSATSHGKGPCDGTGGTVK